MNKWVLKEPELADLFGSLVTTAGVSGEKVNGNWMSHLVRTTVGQDTFYCKIYFSRGRGLRRWIGRSRVRAEWENLILFEKLGVPTAGLVAYGEATDGSYRGAVVTRELPGTKDLAQLVDQHDALLDDGHWRRAVIRRLSCAVRALHANGFVHNDLKWRNILVTGDKDASVYIIDCPMGRKLWGPFLARGIVKDLACLDKVGRYALSRTDRLRFYLAYRGQKHLTRSDKSDLKKILKFFSGRE